MIRNDVHCAPKPEHANPGDQCAECGAKCLDITQEPSPVGRCETWKRGRGDG